MRKILIAIILALPLFAGALTLQVDVNRQRQTIPLKVVSLSQPGAFAISRQWPRRGTWTVRMTATNPDYPNSANSVTVPLKPDTLN